MVMLLIAYQTLSEKFEAHRQAEGLTLAQSRTLAVLYQKPDGLSMPSLVRKAYLGIRTPRMRWPSSRNAHSFADPPTRFCA